MEKKRPQLNLQELHQLKWLLGGVLVLLSAWTVFYLEFDAWILMGLTTLGVLAVLARPAWPARVPAWVHRLAFPVILAFFVGDLVITREILPAIVRLDLLLLFYRGTTYRKKRDDLQVIVLGLFLIVVAGVLTVSLVFAAQILVFTGCALVFLLVITLVDSAEDRSTPAPAADAMQWTEVKWGRLMGKLRAATDWRVAVLGTILFIGVVAVSALLFLAIPRFQLENSLFLERFVSKKARSGFNESIRFGDVTEIQLDDSVAASVDVSDRSQIPADPYWRMLVLDEYLNGSFRLSAGLRRAGFTRERTAAGARGTARPQRGELVYWTFYLESGISRYLPLLGPFEQLRFREMQNYRLGTDLGLVALRDEPVTMTAYRVEGMATSDSLPDPNFARRLAEMGSGKTVSPLMLSVAMTPNDQAALRRVVQEITGGAEMSASDFTRSANQWLWKRHRYSLSPKIPAGEGDSLVRWLASNEGGHCELFAGSYVLLARTAGFPARLVTGFHGGSWNGYSNNFTLRNSDAHAWCEIFDRAAGAWRRADPTPGMANSQAGETRGDVALARRTDRSWSARFDSLRVFWYRRIVNFDQRSQVETLQAVKAATENSGRQLREGLREALQAIKAWLVSPWDAKRRAQVLGMLATIVAAVACWRKYGRDWWRRMDRSGRRLEIDPVRLEAGRWLTRVGEREADDADQELKAGLQRIRFGAKPTWPEPKALFRRARKRR